MISDSAKYGTYRQILDPIGKHRFTARGTARALKAHKVKDLRTDLPHLCKKMPLDFSLFSGSMLKVNKEHLLQGVSKGRHSSHPSFDFLKSEYLLEVSLHF